MLPRADRTAAPAPSVDCGGVGDVHRVRTICVPRARYAVEVNGFVPEIGGHSEGADAPSAIDHAVPFNLGPRPDEFTVLVSGPNTGGKTVLIQGSRMLRSLTQSGIVRRSVAFVITGLHRVFADIGDRQSIAASLSTFSAHVAVLRRFSMAPGWLAGPARRDRTAAPSREGGALAAATSEDV